MVFPGVFTRSDRTTVSKAAALAERLTQQYFNLPEAEWERNPYGIFTCKEVGTRFYQPDVFAHIIRYPSKAGRGHKEQRERYGIMLQDPNILLALLRSASHDLWTLGLFILTHELVHIVRFTKYNVDFFAGVNGRAKEEDLVHGVTKDILAGVTNIDHVLSLYDKEAELLRNA